MQSIKDRVAIVGMGCSRFGARWDAGFADLLVEACHEAFDDAGISVEDIQAAWFGTQTSSTGQPLAHAIKTEYIPITRVENACTTGTDAIRNACHAVAAGIYDLVLVTGAEKLKDGGSDVIPGVPPPGQFALSANRYFHDYGLSYDEGKKILGMIDVKNRHNGSLNPKAYFQEEISMEDVKDAPMQAYPLGLYDCCGVSDGAAAAILTTPENAKKFRDDYIVLKGLGVSVGGRQGQLRDYYDFTHFEETVTAARMAYDTAGIKNAREELSLANIHDAFSISELITYEDLGWSPKGKAREDVESGFFNIDGGLPVNTDGGLLCFGHPIGASGIRMLYEVYKQLQGKADSRQIKNPTLGLTHIMGGGPGSFSAGVTIWGTRD